MTLCTAVPSLVYSEAAKKEQGFYFTKQYSYSHVLWFQLNGSIICTVQFSNSVSPHFFPGCKSLGGRRFNVAPKSRAELCAWRLPLWGVSCPSHGPAARFHSFAAENGLTGAVIHQLGYRVMHTVPYFSSYVIFFLQDCPIWGAGAFPAFCCI